MAIASLKAGESISAGDAVFVSSAGLAYKALADTQDHASVAGVAVNGGASGDLIRIDTDSIYTSNATYTPTQKLYLSILASGSYDTYESLASGLANTSYAGVYITEVGTVVAPNKINVEISLPRFQINPTSVFLLESSAGVTLDAILQEDGSTIDTEDAA